MYPLYQNPDPTVYSSGQQNSVSHNSVWGPSTPNLINSPIIVEPINRTNVIKKQVRISSVPDVWNRYTPESSHLINKSHRFESVAKCSDPGIGVSEVVNVNVHDPTHLDYTL